MTERNVSFRRVAAMEAVRDFYDHQDPPEGRLSLLAHGRGRSLREAVLEPLYQLRDAALGDLAGRRVLELGAGYGAESVELAVRGARVCALDFAPARLALAPRLAEAAGVELSCVAGDCHRLPFDDSSFELVYGNAVLAHLDRARALSEVRRVLKPGGRLVLVEPLEAHPLLRLYRRRLGRGGVVAYMGWDELDADHLGGGYSLTAHGLASPLLLIPAALGHHGRFWRGAARLLNHLDAWFFRREPRLRRRGWVCLAVYDGIAP